MHDVIKTNPPLESIILRKSRWERGSGWVWRHVEEEKNGKDHFNRGVYEKTDFVMYSRRDILDLRLIWASNNVL